MRTSGSLFIYFIIESYREYTHKKEEKKKKKKPLTIKHHTLGLVSAQKTNNVRCNSAAVIGWYINRFITSEMMPAPL